jgi:Putative Ig domain
MNFPIGSKTWEGVMKKALLVLISMCGLGLLNGCGSTATTLPLVATHYSVTSAVPITAGTAFTITITALDANNSPVATYSGTVHFTSSDAQAVLPASATITSGTGTASITLKTAGNQTVTATGADSLTGVSSAILVGPAAASKIAVSPAIATTTTGTAFNFTVFALDTFSNQATSYAGTIHFSSTDGSAILPADSKLTNGAGTFSATFKTSGNQTITATDTVTSSLTGTSFAISASGPATHFSFSAQGSATTRRSIDIGITALDASNNTSTGYSGAVHITSSDAAAILPASVTLQNGMGVNVQITMETPGNQTVTATDTVTPSIKGTSSGIAVTATPPLAITSGAPPAGTVASSYGPTNTIYFLCVFNAQLGRRGCQPCVPNTSTCGGSPTNPYPGCSRAPMTVTCVTSQTFVGFEITGAGGVPPYTWSASSLPPGLTLMFNDPEELINGTPTPGSAATYNSMLTLSDSGMPPAPKTVLFPITINNPPPVVSTAPLFPGATVNQPFSYTFSATAGLPPYQNWTEKGALPQGMTPLTSVGVLSGTPTMTGTFPITVTVDDSVNQLSAAQAFNLVVYQHGFKADGSMTTARYQHTATLLKDGTLLLAGAPGLNTAETYNPATGKFTPTKGSMSVDRDGHTATLLNTGKVLITGGTDVYSNNAALATAEVFDPSTGMFTPTTNNMSIARTGHNAALLADGKVLITGGNTLVAELFDPGTGMFTSTTGKMLTARTEDTATLLPNGNVLITGGLAANAALATAELYDPTKETFSATTGTMNVARNFHTANLLTIGPNSGKVLIAGGNAKNAVAEIYDPAIGTFSTTGAMLSTRQRQTATLLSDGTVLIAGGSELDGNVDILGAAEIFDPTTGTFTGTGGLLTPRIVHTATLLNDGAVLVTGGLNSAGTLATAELYQ